MRDNGRGGGGGMHDIPTQSLSNYSNRRGGDERGSGGRDGVGYGDRDRDRESRASAMKATFDHGAANYDSAPYANTRSNERDRNRDRDREGSNDYGRERSGGGRDAQRGGHREESLSNYAQQGSRDRDSGRDRDGYGSSSLSNYSNGRGGGGGSGGGRRPSYGEDLGGTTDGYNNRSRNNSFSDDRSNARMDRYNGGTLPSSGKTSYEQDPRRHPSTRVHAPPGGHTSFSLG